MPGSTPIYGFPYPDPSDLVANYPALGQQLAEDIEDVLPTIGGLAPSAPTTIANSAGTATFAANTVTFTTVNSVSLNGCFTSSYSNYRIVLRITAATANANVNMRLRAAGTDTSAGYYYGSNYADFGSATGGFESGSNQNEYRFTFALTTVTSGVMDIFSPQLAAVTTIHHYGLNAGTAGNSRSGGGISNNSTVFDGFTLLPSSGTLSGTVSVYGYRK
jgi:hypothetical protein